MKQKLVLLIEDHRDIRENTTELLELAGYRVAALANGQEGLIALKKSSPDIILCDIRMPGIDGYEFFREIKSDPVKCAIPFVFVTSSAEKSEVETALGMGADAYLCKPYETGELFRTIEELIKNK